MSGSADRTRAPRLGSDPVVGTGLALLSALAYAVAGPFGKALSEGGWSVAAVVAFRTGCASLCFAVPMLVLLQRRGWRVPGAWWGQVLRYGVVAMAGVQLCFYTALQYADVAVVLLVEYLAPVLLMLWMWARTRVRPPARVLAGAVAAVAGLTLVIGVGAQVRVDPLGVVWALAAGCCLAAYFGLASGSGDDSPPPVLLVGGGLATSALLLLALGAVGLLPLTATFAQVPWLSSSTPWWLPAGGLALGAGVLAYLTGILAIRRLGSRRASFLALTEVLFAAVVAWALLGEQPTARQGLGAVAVLAGVLAVQLAPEPRER